MENWQGRQKEQIQGVKIYILDLYLNRSSLLLNKQTIVANCYEVFVILKHSDFDNDIFSIIKIELMSIYKQNWHGDLRMS